MEIRKAKTMQTQSCTIAIKSGRKLVEICAAHVIHLLRTIVVILGKLALTRRIRHDAFTVDREDEPPQQAHGNEQNKLPSPQKTSHYTIY